MPKAVGWETTIPWAHIVASGQIKVLGHFSASGVKVAPCETLQSVHLDMGSVMLVHFHAYGPSYIQYALVKTNFYRLVFSSILTETPFYVFF